MPPKINRVMTLRIVGDAGGVLWSVFDVHPSAKRRDGPQVRVALTDGWLCFQSATGKRRLAGIPMDWAALKDEALLALMATATPVASPESPGRIS